MKENSAACELVKLADFKSTRNEWFTKEEKKKRSRKTTPKVQAEEGSSTQPKKKRQKKVVETLLVDEPEEDEPATNVERDQDPESPTMEQVLKDIDYCLETGETAGEKGDDKDKSSSDSKIDETERWKKVICDKKKQKKRKRSGDDDDEAYIPSPEHVQDVQTSPSSGGRKKSNERKHVVSPAAAENQI
ncbi:hypothetical protein Hanom_Chr10g00918721 [Helianthus anomalus]